MTLRPARLLRRFRRDEDGAMTVEAAILLPFLFILVIICFMIFDSIRQHAVAQRSTYVITDMLSRETQRVDVTYLENARAALRTLTGLENSEMSLRVSVIEWDDTRRKFNLLWSQKRGNGLNVRTPAGMRDLAARLPIMADRDQLILVESLMDYTPPINVGVLPRQIETFTFARPRYAPQLLWCAANCTGGAGA